MTAALPKFAKFSEPAPGGEVVRAMVAHALSEYPKESCGVLVGNQYVPCKNTHANPDKGFRLEAAQWARLVVDGDVQAVIHSHPNGPQYPSADDMRDQVACGVTYGIVPCRENGAGKVFFWGDDVPKEPLLERGFRHGVTDCYSLIRDWYRAERGLTLPEVPREWGWWNAERGPGLDLYLDTYKAAGFKSMGRRADLQVGDIVLIQSADSPVVNHAGVYIRDRGDYLIHHTSTVGYDPQKKAARDPVSLYGQFVRDVIRYQGGAA